MKRDERIQADAARQQQLFDETPPMIAEDPLAMRNEALAVNVRARDEGIKNAKRFPEELLLAEYRHPNEQITRHFCIGAMGMTLCCRRVAVTNKNRYARTYDQILKKTTVDCERCRQKLGLAPLVVVGETNGRFR